MAAQTQSVKGNPLDGKAIDIILGTSYALRRNSTLLK
jgi:hypothetical protein